jgi:uncharacterized delta-60 repeat protein
VVGELVGYNGHGRYRLMRINADGSFDESFNAGGGPASGFLIQMLGLSGGSTLLYNLSSPFNFNGQPVARVIRLTADGSVDNSFNIGTGFQNSGVSSVPNAAYEQPDGKIVFGGVFTTYNGQTANGLVRVNTDGSIDSSFSSGTGLVAASQPIISIRGLPDGRLVIGGNFTSYNGTSVNRVAVLQSNGDIDNSFTAPADTLINGAVSQIIPQEDGKFILLGDFTGTTTPYAVRVTSTGAVDPTFLLRGITSIGFGTTRLVMGDDGSLYVNGYPMSYNYDVPLPVARFRGAPVAPSVSTAPASVTAGEGTTATFSVRAAGTAPYTYQWRRNTVDIPGATYSALNLTNVAASAAGSYDVVITNSVSSVTSAAATLTVDSLLQTINFTDPSDTPYTATPITLTATASSGLTVSFSIVSGPAQVTGNSLTLTGAGTVVVRASQAGDATYAAAPDVDQSFVVSSNFGSWQYSVFNETERGNPLVSGPTAVFGQDGLPNLVKYALGLDPKVNATSGLPEVTTDATYWLYTYTRPADRADLTYTVQYSTNLTTWTDIPLGTEHAIVTSGGGTETWRARYALASAANLYFRLKITQ